MKPLFTLLLMAACLICANDSTAQLRQLSLDAGDGDNEVQEFSFYSPSEGYVAFSKYIGYTTDSGRTFTRKYITFANVNYNGYPVNLTFGFGIEGVRAFNQDTLVVYGEYGLVPAILYSIDKGNSFTLVYHDRYDPMSFKSGITDMVFPQNNNIGYAVEADRILKTTNRGLTWSVIRLDVNRYYEGIEAVDNNNLFAFSTRYESSKLFKTTNGGTNWTEVATPAGQINYAYFLTASKGWLSIRNEDQQGEIYYTSNGGFSWTLKNDPVITPFGSSRFIFINDSTGYAKSGLFYVFKTTDSGKVWQFLPRDHDYSYLNYGHNDIQVLNQNQIWAGGGHGFIEMSTNGGGTPLPRALYKIDTAGLQATASVKLRNYSKPNYSYKWFKNDTLISTAYHTSFTHNPYQYRDTIALVVLDGTKSDTLIQYIDYPRVWISDFTPKTAGIGNTVTITGFNFSTAFEVRFGGTRATSFTIISNTEIKAVVDWGASGNVEVSTWEGSASLGGFTFLGIPQVDLPWSVSDSILCKSEKITVTVHNTEPGVRYDLIGWEWSGSVGSGDGNGGTISFVTSVISQSKQYRIQASRIGSLGSVVFNTFKNIKVEHTRARFVADQVNITAGEPVIFAAQDGEASTFQWTFYGDASAASASGAKSPGITYGSGGQKSLRLISISADGCRDTTVSTGVFVYSTPVADQSCYINPMDSAGTNGMAMGIVIGGHDDIIYSIGATSNARKLRSTIGVAKEFDPGSHSFFAKYTTNGVLKWAHYFRPGGGAFTSGKTDAQGNIYLTGYASSTQWLYLNNGDSMQFYAQPVDTTYMGQRNSGFILKLDRDGRVVWFTLLYDHIELWQGYASEAVATHIAIKDDHIVVLGGFYTGVSYARNGVITPLYNGMPRGRVPENYAVLKIKPDGSLLWKGLIQFRANNYHYMSDVTVDKNGNSTMVGTYEEYVGALGSDSMLRMNYENRERHKAFMVRFDANGIVKWHNNFSSSREYGEAGLTKVVADDDGNTYVAGGMFNWGWEVKINITHSDGTVVGDSLAAFALYKFDVNGKRKWGVGSRYPYYGGATALYLKGNEIYAAGAISNNGAEISSFTLTSSDGNNRPLIINAAEAFVAKYDTAGKYKRIYTTGYNYNANSTSPTSLYSNSKDQFIMGGNATTYHSGVVSGMFNINWPGQLVVDDGFFVKTGPDFCKQTLTADAGPDMVDCTNDTVTIGSRASGDYYSWTSNPAGFTSDLSNPTPRPAVNTTYYLKVTNDEGEVAYDTVSVMLQQSPYVNAGNDTTVCSVQAAYIGTPALPGITYQWYNQWPGGPFGSGNPQMVVYPSYTTSYYLRAVGPNGCQAWDTVTVNTIENGQPVLQIVKPLAPICEGDTVVFTSIVQYLGTSPVFQWKLRDVNVGTNSNTYTTDSLKNGDWISLEVIHNNVCLSQPTMGTGTTPITVNDALDPAVTISGTNTVNEGEFTMITATVTDGGPNYTIRWQDSTSTHGWQDLSVFQPGITSFSYRPLKTGDKIRSIIIVSGVPCIKNEIVTSAGISFVVNKVTGINPVPAARYGLRYYPNPTQNVLIIDSLRLQDQWQQLEITSIDGKQTFLRINVNNRLRVDLSVVRLSPGMHVAVLRNRKGEAVYLKFVKL